MFYHNNDKLIKPINDEYNKINNQYELYELLKNIWSIDTCAPRMRYRWNIDNNTVGQCSITAFLVNDIFGGKVYGIPLSDGNFHCFNVIDDVIFDLTSEQFNYKLVYDLQYEQKREDHFMKEEKYQRYLILKNKLKEKMYKK